MLGCLYTEVVVFSPIISFGVYAPGPGKFLFEGEEWSSPLPLAPNFGRLKLGLKVDFMLLRT